MERAAQPGGCRLQDRPLECQKAGSCSGGVATMKLLVSLSFGLLAGCAAQVTHPTKSVSEMQVDIDQCTTTANHKYWMDPVAALYNAYDCLEARGYHRSNADLAAKVEKAVEGRSPVKVGGAPCRIPCRD